MNNILIIEDDLDLSTGLTFSFKADHFTITTADTKQAALELVHSKHFDAIIMDCRLPDGNGFELCHEIKQSYNIPILILTAMDTEIAEINAFENGADDYMSKPFSLSVLKLRVKKMMNVKKDDTCIISNGIHLNLATCTVLKNNNSIDLTTVEYKLLAYLMKNKGQVLSKEQILSHIWDSEGQFVDENIISVNIRRLRLKLEDTPSNPKMIKTIHGIGYIWKEVN